MQIACISVPQRGTIAPNGRATAPGPRGLRPPPLPLRSGRFPCYLPSGRSVCKNHGGASAGRSEAEAGCWPVGNCLQLSMGATPKGKRRGAKAPPGIQLQGRRPSSLGVAKPPQNPQGSRLSVGKCSESTYRRKWQNGGMAHFAILRSAEAQVRGGGPSLHEAQLQSAGHAKRRRRADAPQQHFGAHSVAEGMAAFRSRLPESFRKDAVQAVEYLITASPSAMQGKPKSEQDALLQGLARVAEAASWGGKRGLRRHPPGRDDTTHVRLCGAA